MRVERPGGRTLTLCLLLASAAHAEPAAPQVKHLSIGISAELNGQFGQPDCHTNRLLGHNLGHLTAAAAEAKRAAEAEGRVYLGAVHLGDFMGAGALSRFLAGAPGGPAELAQLIAGTGFAYAVPGRGWFVYPAETLAQVAAALPSNAPTFLNSTMTCHDRPDCEWLGKAPSRILIPAQGETIALIGATSDNVTKQLNAQLMQGITFKPLGATLSAEAEAARKAGATVVIAALHWSGDRGGFGAFENLLHDVSGVDVFLVDDLGDFRLLSAVLHGAGNTTIAVAGRTPTEVLGLDLDLVRKGEQTTVTQASVHRYSSELADVGMVEHLDDIQRRFCAAWNEPLPVVASPPVDRATFLDFTLDQIRLAANAEVAIANESMLSGAPFPLRGPITTSDVFAVVRYDDAIMRARVKGSWLKELRDKAVERRKIKGRPSILWTGLEEKCDAKQKDKCDKILINGRTLNEDYEYTIAVPDFLAAGGDDWIDEQKLKFNHVMADGRDLTVRELVLASMRRAQPGQTIAQLPRPHLENRPRWTYSVGLTLGASDARASNPALYDRHQFEVTNLTGTDLNGELSGRVDADTLSHAFRATEHLYYDWNSSPNGQLLQVQEFLELTYQYRRPWSALDQAWYMPVPYASTHLLYDYAGDNFAPEQLLEAGGDVGVRLIPVENLELKLAAGVRGFPIQQVVPLGIPGAPPMIPPPMPARVPALPGLVIGWDVPRFSPRIFGDNQLDVETSLDTFLAPWQGGTYKELALRIRLLFPLFTLLSLSVGYDMYLFQEPHEALGIYSNVTFGLTARMGGARQQF